MQKTFVRCILPAILPIVAISAYFSACTSFSSSRTLYSWGSYESQVYAYLKGESREAQIGALERDREKTEAGAYAIPPGFYAQLGLLYAEAGDGAMAASCFQAEKAHFPEAAVYMDFLLRGLSSRKMRDADAADQEPNEDYQEPSDD